MWQEQWLLVIYSIYCVSVHSFSITKLRWGIQPLKAPRRWPTTSLAGFCFLLLCSCFSGLSSDLKADAVERSQTKPQGTKCNPWRERRYIGKLEYLHLWCSWSSSQAFKLLEGIRTTSHRRYDEAALRSQT